VIIIFLFNASYKAISVPVFACTMACSRRIHLNLTRVPSLPRIGRSDRRPGSLLFRHIKKVAGHEVGEK